MNIVLLGFLKVAFMLLPFTIFLIILILDELIQEVKGKR